MPDLRDWMLGMWRRLGRGQTDSPAAQQSPPCAAPETPADPLDNQPWLKLVEECVDLFDELDGQLECLDAGGPEIAEHVCLRLQEIMQRCGVELIDQPGAFERTLHQPIGTRTGLSTAAVSIISPGFRVGRRILLRARVRFAQDHSDPAHEDAGPAWPG